MRLPIGKLIYRPDHFVVNIDMPHREFEIKLKGFCDLFDFKLKRGSYGDLYGYVLILDGDPVAWVTVKETLVFIETSRHKIFSYSDEKMQRMLEVSADTDGKGGRLLAGFFKEILGLFYIGKEVQDLAFFTGLTSALYWKNLLPPQDTDYSEFVPPFVKWSKRSIKSNDVGKKRQIKTVQVNPDVSNRNQIRDDEIDMTTDPNRDWIVLLRQSIFDANISSPITKILFAAANPTDTTRLRLGKEFDELKAELERGNDRDKVKLVLPQLATRGKDLSRGLLQESPNIVHFSGHGAKNGAICFETDNGNANPVPAETLGALFAVFEGQVQCVILNACYSATQAQAIAKHIPYVIGMNRAIPDAHAIAFSIGFYQAIANGATIERAYALGKVQIGLS